VNLKTTNRWLTLASNIGVMAGIIFLVFELQQNTVATQLEAASNFQASFSELDLFIAGNPEFAELLTKGREGEEISTADQLRLWVFYGNVLRQWQFSHFQYTSGALDEEIWQANRIRLAQIIGEDRGLLEHWQMNKLQFNTSFNGLLESIVNAPSENQP
jgi:hypothetical protein